MSIMFNCSTNILSTFFICLIICSLSLINSTNLNKAKNNHLHKSQYSLHSHKEKEQEKSAESQSLNQKIKEKEMNKSNIITDKYFIDQITSNKNKDLSLPNFQKKDFFAYAYLHEKCNESICPPPSKCTSDYICQCSEDRADFNENTFSQNDGNTPLTYCNYIRKKQLIAFILEFALISAGHFYIGSVLLGSLKMLLFMASVLLAYRFEEKWSKILATIMFSLLAIWWAIDSALFAVNFYQDRNKVNLMEW